MTLRHLAARSRAPSRYSRRTRGTAPESRPAVRSRGARCARATPENRRRRARAGARAPSRGPSMLFAISTTCAKFDCCELLVERQVEARRAAADVGDEALDARVLVEDGLELLRCVERGRERAALRQAQVDQQLGPRRRRKELLRHERGTARATPTNDGERRGDHGLAVADAPRDRRARKRVVERRRDRRLGIAVRRGDRRRRSARAGARPEPRAASDGAAPLRRSGSIL